MCFGGFWTALSMTDISHLVSVDRPVCDRVGASLRSMKRAFREVLYVAARCRVALRDFQQRVRRITHEVAALERQAAEH
jgi:hypothetical protein